MTWTAARLKHVVLDQHFEQDDHDGPALLALPDGRILGGLHAPRRGAKSVLPHLRAERTAKPGDRFKRSKRRAKIARRFRGTTSRIRICFSLTSGRIYNFYRGFDYDPNYMYSDDAGPIVAIGRPAAQGVAMAMVRTRSTHPTASTRSSSWPRRTILAISTIVCTTAIVRNGEVLRIGRHAYRTIEQGHGNADHRLGSHKVLFRRRRQRGLDDRSGARRPKAAVRDLLGAKGRSRPATGQGRIRPPISITPAGTVPRGRRTRSPTRGHGSIPARTTTPAWRRSIRRTRTSSTSQVTLTRKRASRW